MRKFFPNIFAFFVLIAGLTACTDMTAPLIEEEVIEEETPLGFEVGLRAISSFLPVGLASKVDPTEPERFGIQGYAFEGSMTTISIGSDGRFEVFVMLGEHELQPFSASDDSVAQITFSGRLAPRVVKSPSIVFDNDLRVVANVAELSMFCQSSSSGPFFCWWQRGTQVFAGDIMDEGSADGYFKGVVKGSHSHITSVSVRAGVVLAGVCDKNQLDRYMVVEGHDILAQYSITDSKYGLVKYLGDVYLEVTCRKIVTPAYSIVSSETTLSLWNRP